MQRNNPACYEFPKGKNKLHTWTMRLFSKTSYCSKCGLKLNEEQTLDVWRE